MRYCKKYKYSVKTMVGGRLKYLFVVMEEEKEEEEVLVIFLEVDDDDEEASRFRLRDMTRG